MVSCGRRSWLQGIMRYESGPLLKEPLVLKQGAVFNLNAVGGYSLCKPRTSLDKRLFKNRIAPQAVHSLNPVSA